MTLSKEQVEGKEAVPEGIYEVRFLRFNPRLSKAAIEQHAPFDPRNINLNAEYEVVNNPEYAGRRIYEIASMKSYNIQTEICHGFDVPLDIDENGEYFIPGTWDSRPDFNQELPETYEYKGPLSGKIGKIELAIETFNGRPRNRPRRYFCAIDDCATKFPEIRHVQNLIKG
jgi:hypothetical protein